MSASGEDGETMEARPAEPDFGRLSLSAVLRGVIFALVGVGLVVGMHWYIGARLIAGLRLAGTSADAVWGAIALLFVTTFAGFFARRLRRPFATPLRFMSYGWMGMFTLLASGLAAVDLLSLLVALARGQDLAARWGPSEVIAALAIVLPAFVWGMIRALGPARIERVEVPIASLPEALQGYRIVQISDLHIGEILGRAFTARVVRQVNALAPDAIAVTGALADGHVETTRDQVEPLGELKARDGIFFITGNHEYFNGLHGWLAAVRQLGMEILLNEHRVIQRGEARLVIAGVTDYDGGDFVAGHASSPSAALAGSPDGAPRILLAHQPRTAFDAQQLRVDLQLSGHTHGGQFFPWKYLVRLQQPVLAGLKMIGSVPVYTHRGTGFWGPPLRLLAPPEIAEITLVRSPPQPR